MSEIAGHVAATPVSVTTGSDPSSTSKVSMRNVSAGFGWLAVGQYSNRLLGMLSTLVLAKLLTPADFGLVAIASMMIELIQILKDMGLGEAVVFIKRDDRRTLNTAHTILVGYHLLLFVLLAAASPFVAAFYDAPVLRPVIVLMASSLVLNSLRSVPIAVIRKNLAYRALVVPDVASNLSGSVLAIGLAFAGAGVWSLVAKTLVQGVISLLLLQAVLPYRPRFEFYRPAAVELFHYGKFIVGASIMLVVLYNIDKIFVSRIAGIAALGAFELAVRIAELPARQVSTLVGAVMFPVFSKLDRSSSDLRVMFLRTLKYTASVTLPGSICLSVFGPELVSWIYGPTWQQLGAALRVLALYAAIRSLSAIIHDLMKASGNPHLFQRATVLKLASIGALGAPVVYGFGVMGMATLLVGTWTLIFAWELKQVAHLLDIPSSEPARLLVKPLGLAAFTMVGTYGLLTTAVHDPNGIELLAAIGVAFFGYGIGLYYLDAETASDFAHVAARFRERSRATRPSPGEA
jgi:O-antigen/teichoic acid export membrane protein